MSKPTARHGQRAHFERQLPGSLEDLFPDRGGAFLVPTSLRFSKPLLERIDKLAAAKGITRTEAIERLISYALDALDPTGKSLESLAERRRRATAQVRGGK